MKYLSQYILTLFSLFIALGTTGCKDDKGTAPLPEAVDLKVSIANTNLVMGDNLELTFTVTDDKSETSNEEFDIYLSMTASGLEDPTSLFENFPSMITFGKGEKEMSVTIPVKKEGIDKTYSVILNTFVRGYKVAGASQSISVGDYHYATVSIKNNSDNSVREGLTFILTASVPIPAPKDMTITVTPQTGEEGYYENLPAQLVIPQGETSTESSPITMVSNPDNQDDETLVLHLSTESTDYKLSSNVLNIKKIDIHKGLGSKVMDERYLYEDADQMFVSPSNESAIITWGQTNYKIIHEGDPHPNAGNVLPAGKWKFYRAYEFHHISSCMTSKTSQSTGGYVNTEYPKCFADQNTIAVETAGNVDNARYAWITNDGYLRMITLKEQTTSSRDKSVKDYGTSALYANKFNSNNQNNWGYLPQNVRIYPGMRIETRARIRGAKTGMLPGIWLQGNQAQGGDPDWVSWPNYGEIDVMENNTRSLPNSVEQTFHFGPNNYNPTTSGGVPGFSGKVDQFNIYWMEWLDNETVTMGVNGVETMRATKADVEAHGGKWPFTTEVNREGLHYLLTMMFLGKVAPTEGASAYQGITYLDARKPEHNAASSVIPRMEIDWVRFYIDDTYSDFGKSYNKTLFY